MLGQSHLYYIKYKRRFPLQKFSKGLRATERFHIMVDIPEKMIDNSRHIIKY